MPTLNIYEALRESHEIQRACCTSLTRTSARHPQRRVELFRTLKLELAAHAAAEERFLYAPVLMDDSGLNIARHALAEHHDLDELVDELGAADPAGDAWLEKAKALAHEVRHHLKEEERGFFQVSGKILTEAQKQLLGKRYLKDYARMKKVYAQSWNWAVSRAKATDTPAVKAARRAGPPASAARKVADVVLAGR